MNSIYYKLLRNNFQLSKDDAEVLVSGARSDLLPVNPVSLKFILGGAFEHGYLTTIEDVFANPAGDSFWLSFEDDDEPIILEGWGRTSDNTIRTIAWLTGLGASFIRAVLSLPPIPGRMIRFERTASHTPDFTTDPVTG